MEGKNKEYTVGEVHIMSFSDDLNKIDESKIWPELKEILDSEENMTKEEQESFDELLNLKLKEAHPGEFIQYFIKDKKITKSLRQIAKEVGIDPTSFIRIKNCKRGLSIKTASRLDNYFKQRPNFFIDAQSNHTNSRS